jgi:FkbM family methyltransferase
MTISFPPIESLFPFWPKQIEVDGVKILIRGSPLSPRMRRRLITKGIYETAEREIVKTFIQPGDQILEIGASIGIITSFLVKAAGAGGRTVSVEPDTSLGAYFERQLAVNGAKVDLLNALCCPIWQQPVPHDMLCRRFKPSKNPLLGQAAKPGEVGRDVRWITAEMACREAGLEPTAVMIDIEGTEVVWIERAPQFPRSIRTVIVDFEADTASTDAKTTAGAVQAVIDEGFRIVGVRSNVYAFERK